MFSIKAIASQMQMTTSTDHVPTNAKSEPAVEQQTNQHNSTFHLDIESNHDKTFR